MENINNKNLLPHVAEIKLGVGKAKESGNDYAYFDVKLKNGYSKRVFLNNDSLFAINDALKSDTSVPVKQG